MIRTDFPRESEILGESFEDLIAREGGKGAGLKLLAKVQQDLSGQVPEISQLVIPGHVNLPTGYYAQFERILDALFKEQTPLHWYQTLDEKVRERIQFTPEKDLDVFGILTADSFGTAIIIEEAIRNLPEIKKILRNAYRFVTRRMQPDNEPYHLRSSTTIEDFADDSYWGTFETSQGINFFGKERNTRNNVGTNFMFKHFMRYYGLKRYTDNSGLNDVGLGLVLQKTKNGKPTTAYSSYPEDEEKETKIETERKAVGYMGNGQAITYNYENPELMFYSIDSQGRITVHKGFTGEPNKKKGCSGIDQRLYEMNGKSSLLSEDQVRKLDKILRAMEEHLGYPVNLELMIDNDDLYVVQLRPVPRLNENREVRKLEPLPEGCVLLAETPFVYGSFRNEGKVVETSSNYTLGFRIDEPYIALHWEPMNKAFKWFEEDPNCLGLLNPQDGMVLTHGYSLIPERGEDRQNFVFIGVPGLYGQIEGYLKPRTDNRTIPWKGTQEYMKFKFTDFKVVIESDGRHGRVYLMPEQAEIYRAGSEEAATIKAVNDARREKSRLEVQRMFGRVPKPQFPEEMFP